MKILLDTNIVIHRETSQVVIKEIGILFRWLDNLRYIKCVHPLSVAEVNKHRDMSVRETFNIKMASYNVLQAPAALHPSVLSVTISMDTNENDKNDTLLLNELYVNHVDFLLTEDKKIHRKAALLHLADRVFRIEAFLEKIAAENPGFADYKVPSVRKELFGNIALDNEFFHSFREDYPAFDLWFQRKSEDTAYICTADQDIVAFLFLKVEGADEPYHGISPPFARKKRLKIGSFKVALNGFRLGERFLKIVFDNALRYGVDDIYVTIFDKRLEQQRLIDLLEAFGFIQYGVKTDNNDDELVYVRSMSPLVDSENPRRTYPFFSVNSAAHLIAIYPKYHTNLFPDSILKTESPADFVEQEPFRNAISKVYISRAHHSNLKPGDVLIFYRTAPPGEIALYKSVITTIGIVENVVRNIPNEKDFILKCRKRSVFSDAELTEQWNYNPRNRPFVVNFLYAYALPKRLNLKKLIEMGVIRDVHSAPRGFERISSKHFAQVLEEAEADDRLIIN